ncbi:MAG: ATP-binding cassette domain-containing protein [Spirochaetia bacterium]|nr:ATP-binding cassette domain-containing protein [Spirochaetia bacterium]
MLKQQTMDKSAANDTIIAVSDLSKSYTQRKKDRTATIQAVDSVSFAIQRNSIFGLVGESGCGKTTISRLLVGLEKPDAGSIIYNASDIHHPSKADRKTARKSTARRRMSMQVVFQDANSSFNPKMTLRNSLKEGLHNRKIRGAEADKRINRLADHVGISSGNLDKYPHQFSGGQKQRLAVARALSMEPELLILDEPVSSLDVSIQAQIINLLMNLKDEFSLTYLFISHDLGLVGYMSDYIAVMYRGKIVEQGPWKHIMEAPKEAYTKQLFSAAPFLELTTRV